MSGSVLFAAGCVLVFGGLGIFADAVMSTRHIDARIRRIVREEMAKLRIVERR